MKINEKIKFGKKIIKKYGNINIKKYNDYNSENESEDSFSNLET